MVSRESYTYIKHAELCYHGLNSSKINILKEGVQLLYILIDHDNTLAGIVANLSVMHLATISNEVANYMQTW